MAKQDSKSKIGGGLVDYGRIFEQRIAAHLSIKSALDPNISDFWIGSNIDGVDKFDDIVLMTQDQAGTKNLYCIQLKHSEKSSALQAMHLESKSSRFYLKKYEESFDIIEKNITSNNIQILKDISIENVHLIVWTNSKLTAREKMPTITAENVGGLDFLNTSPNGNIYKLKNLPSSGTPYNEKFFERFRLFDEQASAVAMEKVIKDELFTHFKDVSNSVVVTITDYFTKWSMGDKRTHRRISKSDVQIVLLEFLFLPHLVEPIHDEEINLDKFDMMNDTLRSFNVTPLTEPKSLKNIFCCTKFVLNKLCRSGLNLQIPWSTDLSPAQWETLKAIEGEDNQKIRKILLDKKMFVPYLTIRDVYLAAWQCRLIPIVIDCTASNNFIENILVEFKQVTKDLSFILLYPVCETFKGNLKVFNSINDLEDDELKNRNLDETFVSLQGKKEMKLIVYKDNEEVLQGITPNVYLMLIEGIIQLGEVVEVENYYIPRDLRRPIVKLGVLDENSNVKNREHMFTKSDDIFILVEYNGSLPLRYQDSYMDLEKYVKEKVYGSNEKIYILVTNFTDFDNTVTLAVTMLHNETSKSIHVMKLNNKYLEWSYSKGTVESLQKHLIETNLMREENPEYNIPENDILQRCKSQVNIISNNAGMGKTFMLKSLANKFGPDEWVWHINLSEEVAKIPQEKKFVSYFNYMFQNYLKVSEPCVQKLMNRIYINCFQQKKIVCLFDGYDEVSSAHVLQFLKEAKSQGLRMWITTRPTYKIDLEMHMANLSIQITHFSTEDHVMFLWKYFNAYHYKYQFDDTQIQYIIDTINKYSSKLDKTLVSLPLQTRMFAEIFGDDIDDISKREDLTIVDLYNKFVDVKLKEYKSYEATSLKKTLSKLALKLFFTKEQLEDLVDFVDLGEEAVAFQESYKKDSIVIGLDEKGDAVFGHRTFAEFLAAYWLNKQIVNRKGGYNIAWIPLLEKLYYIEMIPVRVFFDRISSQNLPLHIAVLNNDLKRIQSLLGTTQTKQSLDVFGRSALHLAVTYGRYYDLYIAREIKGLRNVGLHSIVRNTADGLWLRVPLLEEKQYQISSEIVRELLSHGFSNSTDRLFRYDLFDYAMKSCSLNFLHILYEQFDKTTLYFEIGFSFEVFLYCIVHDNLYNILSKRKVYNYDDVKQNQNEMRDAFKGFNFKLFKEKYNEVFLSEAAAVSGSTEILYEILKSGALKIEDGNLVHKVCFGGHAKILELLYKVGADMEKPDDSNWSPLYQAGKRGRTDITYQLLKDKRFLSQTKSATKMTPLHFAVQGGHIDCVKKLIDYGVKVNVKDAYNFTPLFYACQYGYHDIIELILKSGAIDITDRTVKSIINVAAFYGYAECIQTLLECGLNVNNIDGGGNSPLVIASKKGFTKIISQLASSGKCDMNLMVRNETMRSLELWVAGNNHIMLLPKLFLIKCDRYEFGGITALHFASRHGHAETVKTLIDLGANKHIEDTITNYSPLIWASMYGNEKVIKALLTQNDENEDVTKTRGDVELAMIWASMVGHEKCVEVLYDYTQEFDTEFIPNEEQAKRLKDIISAEFKVELWFIRENENMLLLLAAKNNCPTVIRTLISKQYRNNDGLEEAMHWAAKNGHLDCVKELMRAGADDNKKNEKHLRLLPIAWASMYGKTNVVEYLLSNKTQDYLQNKDLHVALNWAAVGGHYNCLKLLLNFGLDVDNMDPELKGTPLINACQYTGTIDVIDALMRRRCKVDAKNVDGKTALDIAAERKNFEFVKKFINCGAFRDYKIEEGSELLENLKPALQWAVDNEDVKLIERLVELGIAIDKK